MRRTAIVLLLLAMLCGIAWWLWSWRAVKAPPPDPWSMVPRNAVAVLEVPTPMATWARFTGTSQFWGELEGANPFGGIHAVLARLAQADSAAGKPRGTEQPMVVAWYPSGDSLSALVAWPLEPTTNALRVLGAALHTDLPATLWKGSVIPITPDSLLPSLHITWHKGLLLISAAPEMLHAAGSSVQEPVDSLFQKARASLSAGADAHLLVKPSYASRLLAAEEAGIFPQGKPMQGWAAMDVRLRPDAVLMNGLLFPAEGQSATAAIHHQQPDKPDVIRVLPATVCRLRTTQVDDPAQYVRDITGEAPDEKLFTAYAAWIHGTIGTASEAADGLGNQWAVFGTGDPGRALAALSERCPDGACPTDEYRGIRVQQVPDQDALAALFGPAYTGFTQPYWAVLADLVVMSNTPAGMRAAIDAWTDRNSLTFDPRSGDFFRRFSSDAVYSWWMDNSKATAEGTGTLADARKATGGMLVQLSPGREGTLATTFCLQHAPEGKRAAGALWTMAMPAPLEGPPILVKDYLSKTWQVLVQDREHRISLISCTGKLLWQRILDGPILGGVEQVDRYRNNKLQMIIGTAGKVYLIDRLGRDVEGFPVTLKDSACAPPAVFDYDHEKDYRILVPLANGKLLNLGADGKPVDGWDLDRLRAPAVATVEHVRIKGKDYLVVPMQNGQVAVLDRRGNVRHAAKLNMEHMAEFLGSRDAMYIGDRRMLWADSAGAVLSGTVDGQVDTLSQATSGKVAIFDVDGDGHDEVLRTTGSALSAEAEGSVLFRVSFPDAAGAKAFRVPLDGEDAVGVVLPEQEQIRLYNAGGELWPGFPMKGAVRFRVADINLDGVLEVITADGEGVVSMRTLPAGT